MLINICLWIVQLRTYYIFQAVNVKDLPCWNLYVLSSPGSVVERERRFGLVDCSKSVCGWVIENCDGVFVRGCRFPDSLHDGIDVVIFMVESSNLERNVKDIHTCNFPRGASVFLMLDHNVDVLMSVLKRELAVHGIITKKRFFLLDSTLRLSLLSVVTGYLLIAMYVFLMIYQKRAVTILPVLLNAQKTRRALESEMSQVCSICLENFSSDSIIRELACRHVFHSSCVDPWLLYRCYLCPLCRKGPDNS